MAEKRINRFAEMVLACNEDAHYTGEKLLEDHALVRIVSGELKVIQVDRAYTFGAGDTLLFPKNQLSTLIKNAKDGRPYKSVVIRLATALLREYYAKHTFDYLRPALHGILTLDKSPLLESYFASVLPYFDLQSKLPEKLISMKTEEAVEILRNLNPKVDGILSDFSQPGKIHLADFMERNYMFNIPLEKFSVLTGRSLTSFKRDFKKTFNMPPQKWLTQKRLELAHYQLAENKRKPMDVYYETGFENLSHFSYAFKKHFGYSPTSLTGK